MNYTVYSDGGCSKTKGGYASVINEKYVISGSCKNTTNNIMEIAGIYEAIKYIKETLSPFTTEVIPITVYSDSRYAIGIIGSNWKAQKNTTLVYQVRNYVRDNNIKLQFYWVKGHSGIKQNEIADMCASKALKDGYNDKPEYSKQEVFSPSKIYSTSGLVFI